MPRLEEIKSAIPTVPVVVVSKSYCPFCRRAKGILDSYNIEAGKIKVFEIENDSDMDEIQAYMGQVTKGTTVPRVFIGGQFVGGCDDVAKLHSNGQLGTKLAAAGAIA